MRAEDKQPGEREIGIQKNHLTRLPPHYFTPSRNLHGYFFQVLDDTGEPVRPIAWKDTVNIPFDGTARLLVRFDGHPGGWMFHCHILDHAEGGLMGMVNVGTAAPHPSHQHATPTVTGVIR